MTGKTRRQLLLLGALAVVLVYVMVRMGQPQAEQPPAPSNAQGQATTRPTAAPEVADVKLELLEQQNGSLDRVGRDPFRFQPKPAPAPRQAPPPSRVEAFEPPPPAGPPPPPPIALRFIGFVEPEAGAMRVAVFSDTRGNVFTGKEGDIIEGRYRLLRIGSDSADLAYLDGRGRQTIRLSGQ